MTKFEEARREGSDLRDALAIAEAGLKELGEEADLVAARQNEERDLLRRRINARVASTVRGCTKEGEEAGSPRATLDVTSDDESMVDACHVAEEGSADVLLHRGKLSIEEERQIVGKIARTNWAKVRLHKSCRHRAPQARSPH